jgi:hypothetical protein
LFKAAEDTRLSTVSLPSKVARMRSDKILWLVRLHRVISVALSMYFWYSTEEDKGVCKMERKSKREGGRLRESEIVRVI